MPRQFVRAASACLIALLAGCAGDTSTGPLTRIPDGNWGGPGIGLVVDATGVLFLFDCAGGHVAQPIELSGDGSFDVVGIYTGGGNTIGADHSPHPARYTGRATRSQVQVMRTLLDSPTSSGTFVATLGRAPMVVAC
jgi:hypothetical protein